LYTVMNPTPRCGNIQTDIIIQTSDILPASSDREKMDYFIRKCKKIRGRV